MDAELFKLYEEYVGVFHEYAGIRIILSVMATDDADLLDRTLGQMTDPNATGDPII
jgi:hypothetical protein